jgi:hypothetical protein
MNTKGGLSGRSNLKEPKNENSDTLEPSGSDQDRTPDTTSCTNPVPLTTGYYNPNPATADETQWEWTACNESIDFQDLWFAVRGGGGGTYGIVNLQRPYTISYTIIPDYCSSLKRMQVTCQNLTVGMIQMPILLLPSLSSSY